MAQSELVVRRFALLDWSIQGVFSGRPTAVAASTPPADGGTAKFGSIFYCPVDLCVGDFRLLRGTSGSSGTTTVEVWRLRASVWTLLTTLSAASGTSFTMSSASMGGQDPLSIFQPGDVIISRLVALEAGSPADLVLRAELR